MTTQRKIILSLFFWSIVMAVGISYIFGSALLNSRIEARKTGEDIGYRIGWEAGSNACYAHK
jgi:hypothetical protein